MQLAECRDLLGRTCFAIVSSVCGEGHALRDAGFGNDQRGRVVASAVLKFALDDLAENWGLLRQRSF